MYNHPIFMKLKCNVAMSAHLVIILKYLFFIICTNTPICINSVIFTHLVIIFKYLFFIIYLIVSLTRLER